MPVEVLHGSLEERILKYLLEAYPVTVAALALQGVLELEELPDKTYVRLLRQDLAFYGYKESQRKRFKRSDGKRSESKDVEGPMFG